MNDKFVPTVNFKIMSGGQTGADRAGLDWAIAHGRMEVGVQKGRPFRRRENRSDLLASGDSDGELSSAY